MQCKIAKRNQWAFCQWKRFMIISYCISSMTAIAWHMQSGQTDFNDVITKVYLSAWAFRSYTSISFPQEVRGRFLNANSFLTEQPHVFWLGLNPPLTLLKVITDTIFMLMCLYNSFPLVKSTWIKKKNTGDKNVNLISVVSIKK